jgi:hypothetical protein
VRVLVACEFSGVVRDAFAAKGHDAWSCDLLPTEKPGQHIQDDVLKHLGDGWDLMVAHPPCTRLCNSGVRWLAERDLWVEMREACQFFLALRDALIPRRAIENPIPHKYARYIIGRYQQRIQPYDFDVPETKATCLWLRNLPPLMSTIIETTRYPRVHRTYADARRWKDRSRTPVKMAEAFAAQWGGTPGRGRDTDPTAQG